VTAASPAETGPPPRVKTAFAIVLAAVVLAILYWVQSVIFVTFLGALLALLIGRIADALERWLRLPRRAAVFFASLGVLLVLAGVVALLVVPLVAQASRLGEALPRYAKAMEEAIARFREAHPRLGAFLPEVGGAATGLAGEATKVVGGFFGAAVGTVHGLVTFLSILFLGFFFALEPDRYVRGVAALWPGPEAGHIWLLGRIGRALRAWMVATGIDMLVIASLWTFGLWLAGVDYFLVFGIVGGFLQVLPYFGPTIAFVPPFLIALTTESASAAAVAGVYVAVHAIDSFLVLPYLIDREVAIPPAVVVIAILALGAAFGFWGTLLSMPILTVIYVIVNQVYLRPAERPAPRVVTPPGGEQEPRARGEAGAEGAEGVAPAPG
jgi:predicted PurR-regulated permease PerM